jgi:hypothetical protein
MNGRGIGDVTRGGRVVIQPNRVLVILVCVIALALPQLAYGQDAATSTEVVLHLTDRTVLPGRIVEETDDSVVLDHASLGRLEVARETIERIEYIAGAEAGERRHWNTDPSRNSILLTPTPATLPKGTGYFRSIELLLINFGYAPTDFLNLAVGTMFPIAEELFGIMLGAKLSVLDREEYPVGLALTGSYTYFDELQNDALWTAGGVLGIGSSRQSLNVSVGGSFSGNNTDMIVMVGGDFQASARTKIIAEFGNTGAALFDDDDFNGLMNIGLRFFGENMSFTLTGFRPLEDSGGLILFPLAVFSINW